MDIKLPGFGVRARKNGQASFGIRWMNERGRHRKKMLGDVRLKKVDDARKSAFWRLGEYQAGRDPDAERVQKRKDILFEQLVIDVFGTAANSGVTQKHLKDQRRSLEKHAAPILGKMAVRDIEPMDLSNVLMNSGLKPAGFNRLRSALSKVFKQAQIWRIRFDDPTLGLPKKNEYSRERVLSKEELDRVWKALNETPNQTSANAIRLMILTGARPKEILSATWDQFDLDNGTWTKPAMSVKQRKTHRVEMHSLAVGILKEMQENRDPTSPFLFPSNSSTGHLMSIKTLWNSTKRRAGVPDIRPYDLRKTFITNLMSNSQISLAEVMAITGHTQPSVLLKYYGFATGKGQKDAIQGAIELELD